MTTQGLTGTIRSSPRIIKLRLLLARGLARVAHLRLPAPSILPITGALVGIYAGLAAGLFSALIGAIQLVGFGLPRVVRQVQKSGLRPVAEALRTAPWHPEYLVAGIAVAAAALALARLVPRTGDGPDALARRETRTRLEVIAFMVIGGLALFFPIVALSSVNAAFGVTAFHGLVALLDDSPGFVRPVVAALGGILVARILRSAPEARGGGLGQVIHAVSAGGTGIIPTRVGIVKLFASSVTLGVGGSAGREGPVVQMGGSVGSTVAQALGFTRRDLVVLVGCGSAAGIAASFNAPIAGAMFALEIILRDFEVRVFAPIMLASVSATMTARALMAESADRHAFHFASTPEIVAYVVLGLLAGVLAISYVRGMDLSTRFFSGKVKHQASQWLARQSEATRCVLGGLGVGVIGLVAPRIMGAGQESLGAAMDGQLAWHVLLAAALLKLVATALTLGSGASGGTFFPAMFIGGMFGGAFGTLLEHLFPGSTGGAGSYALVGMAASVAGFTRAPLTAIVIVFELTNNYTAILPLMVACTTASSLCQAVLGHAHGPSTLTAAIPDRPVREFMAPVESLIPLRAEFAALRDALLISTHGVAALVDDQGRLGGLALLRDIHELLRDDSIGALVKASDVARPALAIPEDLDLRTAREQLEDWEVPAAPVVATHEGRRVVGMIALADIRAAARKALSEAHTEGH